MVVGVARTRARPQRVAQRRRHPRQLRRFPRRRRGTSSKGPIAFLVEYRDGLKATVLQLDGHVADETFAARVEGEKKPESCLFWLPPPPGAAFLEALASHVETFLATGKPPYPVERTQLTGGILDYALESLASKSKRLETPDLDIRYDPAGRQRLHARRLPAGQVSLVAKCPGDGQSCNPP